MPKTVNVKQVVEEIGNLKIRITELEHILSEKKKVMAHYFEKSGKNTFSSGGTTVYVQTKTTIDYDIPALKKKLDRDLYEQIVDRKYVISDINGFKKFIDAPDIPFTFSDLKPFISVEKSVNKDQLSKLYEIGEISLNDLDGCYNAKVTKTVAQRIKPE